MNRCILIGVRAFMLAAMVATAGCAADDLAAVRTATDKFHKVEAAQAAGYQLVEGLDHCFNNPGTGGMGYHYIDTAALDTQLDVQHPEAMVYAPTADGGLELGAVEYIVPAEPWDKAGNSQPPSLLGRHLHLNKDLGVYVLHAWIWKDNSAGVYEDWNPKVTCPEALVPEVPEELAPVQAATDRFHNVATAETAGYGLVDGLDHCFDNPGTGGMGIHLINVGQLDTHLDTAWPEAMVYTRATDGKLELGAVEYIVPAEPWDKAGNSNPPTLLGRSLHLNKDLGVYVLHAWIWKENPAGVYEDWNPQVSCPKSEEPVMDHFGHAGHEDGTNR